MEKSLKKSSEKGFSLAYPLKELRKMQRKAVLWILGAFGTFLTLEIKAIAILVPIHLYIQKLSGHHQPRTATTLNNHVIKSLLKERHSENTSPQYLLLDNITLKQ